MPRKKTKANGGSAATKKKRAARRGLLLKLLIVCALLLVCTLVYLDAQVRYTFAERKWAVPARVYARPLELYRGLPLRRGDFEQELQQLGYRKVAKASRPGEFSAQSGHYQVHTRGFAFWDGSEAPGAVRLEFDSSGISQFESRENSAVIRLEPLQIGSIYPAHNEDRVLVQLAGVPQTLVDMLLVMEDRDFFTHHGVAPMAIARAAWVNLRAGEYRQGGSTLTQQLVKNYYLSSQRSLSRKAKEALMALSLDWHFSKEEILEGYINEIFLGQDGPRAIHGFGLASQYYFNQPLQALELQQLALLVALVRGPSYYDPWRHPERAIERRNRVLAALREAGSVDVADIERAQLMPLGVGQRYAASRRRYPAYLDLVRRQLQRDYRAEDLSSEGLVIFTNLDPVIQQGAERSLAEVISNLQGRYEGLESLEGAVIISQPETGSVLAVVGGRNARFAGFNRALDAQRPIGSLVKPAVYLTALLSGDYTLASQVRDQPLSVELANGDTWSPRNFDKESHGDVPLFVALAKSYNQATAALGMDLGVDKVLDTLARLGVERELPAVPSILLGSRGLSVLEVAQSYQTIASDGFYTPLQAIRAVTGGAGERLNRYDIAVEQRLDPEAMFLLQAALQQTARWGTARGLRNYLPEDFSVAAKTGTSSNQRDSWFAGFSGDLLGVAWLGKDDNGRTSLTGSSGALRVWGEIFKQYSRRPLRRPADPGLEYLWIDEATGLLSAQGCEGAHRLPFVLGSAPQEYTECGGRAQPGWFKRMLGQ